MKGLMMDYPLTTNTILEYGNSVYHQKNNKPYQMEADTSIVLVTCINAVKVGQCLNTEIGNHEWIW
jgi:hypothetical protein